MYYCSPGQRIKDVTSFSCLLQFPRQETKFRFVLRFQRENGEEGKKKETTNARLVNNTKCQVARKRRYFSGGWWCTRAKAKWRGKRLKGKGTKERTRKGETKEIHHRLYFQCYVNAAAYGIMEMVMTTSCATPARFIVSHLSLRPRGIIILIGTT